MKSILSFLLAFIVLTSLQAQSDQQLTKVLSETNRSKLISESIILMEQSKTLKAIAVEAALQNGWPITMETETSFAELQQLDENGLPVYNVTDNVNAAITTSTNKIQPGGALGLNLTGTGMLADGDESFTKDTDAPAPPTNVTATPSSIFQGQCSNLNATSVGNKIKWYDVATDGTPLATVNSGQDLPACPEITKTYYAESFDPGLDDIQLINSFMLPTNYGVFMDVTVIPGKGNQTIDAILFKSVSAESTMHAVYYRVGSYVGHETSSSGWDYLTYVYYSNEETGTKSLNIPNLVIPEGSTYSFYVFDAFGKILCGNGTIGEDDDNFHISSGSVTHNSTQFGSSTLNMFGTLLGVRYLGTVASSETRTPVTVTVNPVTWTAGASTSNWDTPGNWNSSSVPTISQDVVIPNITPSPVIQSETGANCKNLTIQAGASLTVQSGGSLITEGTITNSGTFTAEKAIAGNSKWHLISSPNNNTTSTNFEGFYLQSWDESTATWNEITEYGVGLTRVKGYSLYDVPAKTTFGFTGTPNTGDQNLAMTTTDINSNGLGNDNDGANLLGNPYPSSIDWDGLRTTYGSVYYWNGTAYVTWNNGGAGSRYIAPAQGFFVLANGIASFSVGNSNRTHSGATTYYKSENKVNNGVVIAASNGSYDDDLWIMFREASTNDFDFTTDACKFYTNTPGIAQIYTLGIERNLSIDVRPETELIPLGFRNDENGNYSILMKDIDGIAQAEIEDTKTNSFHNLSNGAYTFDWNTSDSEERFILHLKATGTNYLEAQAAKVYTTNHRVYVRQSESISYSEMAVYDLRGRLIVKKNLSATSLQSFELNESFGAYLVQLKGESGTKSFKIVL